MLLSRSLPVLNSLRRQFLVAIVMTAVLLSTAAARCDGPRMIEIQDEKQAYIGKVVAIDQSTCCVVDRMGFLYRLDVPRLKSFRVVSERFDSESFSVFRRELRREFSDDYDIAATSHYLVCGQNGSANTYADLFEEIYRSAEQFYRVRGITPRTADTPLVAIVFASRQEFADYCAKDDIKWSPGLLGYYSLKTNRVALYDDPSFPTSVSTTSTATSIADATTNDTSTAHAALISRVGEETAGTIIHEAIHQASYNMGIHSRVGGTPGWVVEGLATVLETPGTLRKSSRTSASDRANSQRLAWFRNAYGSRRRNGDLARLVAEDKLFQTQTLDAYSEAWAVMFFLTENPVRTRQLSSYLMAISERDPMKPYTRQERLADFCSAFGEIDRLETEFQRFIDKL